MMSQAIRLRQIRRAYVLKVSRCLHVSKRKDYLRRHKEMLLKMVAGASTGDPRWTSVQWAKFFQGPEPIAA